MRKTFIHNSFGRWLKINHQRFKHRPVVIVKRYNIWRFQFENITPCIRGTLIIYSGQLQCGCLSVDVYRNKEHWDRIYDNDIITVQGHDGKYYCRDCADYHSRSDSMDLAPRYHSIQQLWAEHTFEDFLEWANAKLQRGKLLNGYKYRGCTWANIVEPLDADDEVLSFSVSVETTRSQTQDRIGTSPIFLKTPPVTV